jgi:2-polyprenyl-3-methyl-5-hydroxy-6-metoxy-1,4-benzoquinol methylase
MQNNINDLFSPIVFEGQSRVLEVLSTSDISKKWLSNFNIDVSIYFDSIDMIEYRECLSTGLRFYAPVCITGCGLLYSQLQRFGWYYMDDKWEFDVALSELLHCGPVLEVGSAKGAFLDKLSSAGITSVGVELNDHAASVAIERGFKVEKCNIEDLQDKYPGHFGAVCAFQVLEHISNPKDFFDSVFQLLTPGGKIIFSVPDNDFMKKIDPFNENLLNSPPHHVTHWSADVFNNLQKYYPLKLVSFFREPLAYYHVDWYVVSSARINFRFLNAKLLRILFNRYTLSPLIFALKAGFRKRISGHTLLVVFEYCP